MLIVTFGHEANAAINGLTVTMTPYETPDSEHRVALRYRPGTARVCSELGTAGGGLAANYTAPTVLGPVPARHLPAIAVVSRRRAR